MVDRAFSQQARAALDLFAHHARERPCRTGANMIGRSKNGDRRAHSERGSDVHAAGVVGQIDTSHAAVKSMYSLSVVSPAKL